MSLSIANKLLLLIHLENFENISFREVNKEVCYATNKVVKISKKHIQLFKKKASYNKPQKIRLCAHKDINDRLHEMFIIFGKETYIRPHKHPNKSVSYHIVEGSADVVLFNEAGNLVDVVQMGNYSSRRIFYFRIEDPYYYAPIPRSSFLVFHEITNGPFSKSHTVFAPWAPEEIDNAAVKVFKKHLSKDIKNFLAQNNHG